MMVPEREAYLQFACGYLHGALTQIRVHQALPADVEARLNHVAEFIHPILSKLYQPPEPQPNRFLLFTDQELKSLQSSLFSNDKVWRTLIENELKRRET